MKTNSSRKHKDFIAELDKRYKSLEKGIDKGYTSQQLQHSIDKLRAIKYAKKNIN